ncbi:MAG: GNAT family N-acetyltransferase [Rhodoferax sp.]|nr:GNAT family N-acetyltransferase [Rhodoferax sp.]
MASRLLIEQLRSDHLAELATELRHPAVYEYIGGVPTLHDFVLDRERALRGPSQANDAQLWLNFLVREHSSGAMLGRVEATVHDSIAEVAFLFGPPHWGRGYALEALAWLHEEIDRRCGVRNLWATTVPTNVRCQSLLRRSGYTEVRTAAPPLLSFDSGDLVFNLRRSA